MRPRQAAYLDTTTILGALVAASLLAVRCSNRPLRYAASRLAATILSPISPSRRWHADSHRGGGSGAIHRRGGLLNNGRFFAGFEWKTEHLLERDLQLGECRAGQHLILVEHLVHEI